MSIVGDMAQSAAKPPMLLERRTGRSQEEFDEETLTFEEALARFLAMQDHKRQHGVFTAMNGARPGGVGEDKHLKQAGVIIKHSAEYYARLLAGPELERARERGEVSQDVCERINDLAQASQTRRAVEDPRRDPE